ncbi:peptidase T [Crocinitomicaceae bacterium CZZ-1]|uniref:Peptidase T n=1 Tax=Taishania pollutisoli TaxID=2766479 RepID=A0A8J6U2N0_9FLAO|nr:peptidase T [Taishania pollutisoli]MBC9813345.1 peptidase T [Taishania pollutisoli]MBX2948886.1 peptidase T [Crocinitomicaceae bacterium]NGF77069.1 peptidase T [Fluviicola sp. SGL-29]
MSTYKHQVEENFIRYAKIDTTADPNSTTFPSTMKQKDLAKLLVKELIDLGLKDAEMDEWGYVFATIPGNTDKEAPTICFCSHMDTAPDVTGTNVKPIVHRNYNGSPITLPDDPTQVITIERHPYLKEKIGDDIITASGTTLLGADDKAGIAIIMDFANYIVTHPEVKHGDIRILFTPDEEVGRGVDHLDIKKLNADYGYTLDGGVLGSIEDETFSADSVKVTFKGVSAHPGYAKGKMINALKLVADFVAALPKDRWSPETTEGREGFVHPVAINGIMEEASVSFIIRDHLTEKLSKFEDELQSLAQMIIEPHNGATMVFEVKEQYRNMKEVLQSVPFVTDYAIEAMKRAGIEPRPTIIRGGTDGSRLSFMGLPCPNLFTGEMGIHSKQEYVSVQDMEKAVKTMVELIQIWEGHED